MYHRIYYTFTLVFQIPVQLSNGINHGFQFSPLVDARWNAMGPITGGVDMKNTLRWQRQILAIMALCRQKTILHGHKVIRETIRF